MIFKQYTEILTGKKTQTRRIVKPGEIEGYDAVYTESYPLPLPHQMTPRRRTKWQVGRDYAIVPGRGKPAWWLSSSGIVTDPRSYGDGKPDLIADGYAQARIVIAAIRREPLLAITHTDAIQEGVESVGHYLRLWDSINRKPGVRWRDNPDVWVITFRLDDATSARVKRLGGKVLEAA